MQWQDIIISRLNLCEISSKIILDHTGLLTNNKFLEYLRNKEIEHLLVENVSQLLTGLKHYSLIISTPISLPGYISSKVQVINFDLQLLPIEIDPNIFKKLHYDQLSRLMEYLISQRKLTYVKKDNYISLINKTKEYEINSRLKVVEQKISNLMTRKIDYDVILTLGTLWGEYIFLSYLLNYPIKEELQLAIDQTVEPLIITGQTKEAFYSPGSNPKTVDRILPFVKNKNREKTALICFDGMGVAEWLLLKEYLNVINFNSFPMFALIPTITRISRSAIFYANNEIVYELNYINEDKAFTQFFDNKNTASFREGQIDGPERLLGINTLKMVYNMFDDIAHKTILPLSEENKHLFFENCMNYLKKSSIKKEFSILKEAGFSIYLCSDHGSVLATGNGQRIDKYLIEASSKRGTLVKKSELVKFYNVNTMEIPFIKDKLVLLAKNRTSFSAKSTIEITHGGISLDEFVVPFVEILS
ncbi:MAG: hypothetical protein ACFFFT_05460 [Candidatus Thorarchaeota archaeon]